MLAVVFRVRPDEVTVRSTRQVPGCTYGQAAVGHDQNEASFSAGVIDGHPTVTSAGIPNHLKASGHRLTEEEAKAMAGAVARAAYPRWSTAQLHLTQARAVGMGPAPDGGPPILLAYQCDWDGILKDRYYTGNSVSVIIDAEAGVPELYSATFGPAPLRWPTITAEQAEETAWAEYAKHVPPDALGTARLDQCRCHLGGPKSHPVWFFGFVRTMVSPSGQVGPEMAQGFTIDGISGELLAPRSPEHFPGAAPSTGH